MSCSQSNDIDSLFGEGLVDVLAQLLTLARLVRGTAVLVGDGVQGQNNALNRSEDALGGSILER
ncbi:hypothetical protein [Streptomyces sp. NBC_00063]|uniref:hypothetical protein n=1 Tax=Streptomyces sp. NBC_00063 TaxID=2975638 RepID=UPI003D7440E2